MPIPGCNHNLQSINHGFMAMMWTLGTVFLMLCMFSSYATTHVDPNALFNLAFHSKDKKLIEFFSNVSMLIRFEQVGRQTSLQDSDVKWIRGIVSRESNLHQKH